MDNTTKDIFLTSLADPNDPYTGGKPGIVCQVPAEQAAKFIEKRTHRQSTDEEIAEYKAENKGENNGRN